MRPVTKLASASPARGRAGRVLAPVLGLVFVGDASAGPPPRPAPPAPSVQAGAVRVDPALAGRFAELALACVHKEYPNKIAHVLSSDADVRPPRELTPAFYGCFDWHSAVHGHWLLARLLRLVPGAPWAGRATAALEKSLTPENLRREAAYLLDKGRSSFERPYGLAWLLQLGAELAEWDGERGRTLAANLRPLEDAAALRLRTWLPKLSRPVRSGEHSQTAFALGLALDWARTPEREGPGKGGERDPELAKRIAQQARLYYQSDTACPIDYEPSGEDFLSPCLAEADLMRRVLPTGEFTIWLEGFLPWKALGSKALLPAVVTDPTDGKLAHLDGLNLSRAFMLEGIASALAVGDPKRDLLFRLAAVHRTAGVRAVTGEHYEGGHWLGSFATYLVTGRGLGRVPPGPGGLR